jgi:hypothetical protein
VPPDKLTHVLRPQSPAGITIVPPDLQALKADVIAGPISPDLPCTAPYDVMLHTFLADLFAADVVGPTRPESCAALSEKRHSSPRNNACIWQKTKRVNVKSERKIISNHAELSLA